MLSETAQTFSKFSTTFLVIYAVTLKSTDLLSDFLDFLEFKEWQRMRDRRDGGE